MKIRTVIVEDEALARRRLRQLIDPLDRLDVLEECPNGTQAVECLNKLRPQLVFLDVQMPGLNGFEVLERLDPENLPLIVFTTAYDEHAVRAFEENALDYLVKPIARARFLKAIERVLQRVESQETTASAERLLRMVSSQGADLETENYLTRLTIRDDDRVAVIDVSEIQYIESAGNYVSVHVGNQTHILRDSLSHLEKQLDPRQFYRVSRSALVNLRAVKEFQPTFKGESVLVLDSGATVPVTRGIRELEKALRFS